MAASQSFLFSIAKTPDELEQLLHLEQDDYSEPPLSQIVVQNLGQQNALVYLSQPGQEIVIQQAGSPFQLLRGSQQSTASQRQMALDLGGLQPLLYDTMETASYESPLHYHIDHIIQPVEDRENVENVEPANAPNEPRKKRGRPRGSKTVEKGAARILRALPVNRERKRSSRKKAIKENRSKLPVSYPNPGPDFFAESISGWYKPPYTFTLLIALALYSTSNKSMSVAGMYSFIKDSFPFFAYTTLKWKNSLRHNLSLERCFIKTENHRTPKKGYDWTFNPERTSWLAKEISKRIVPFTELIHCLKDQSVLDQLFEAKMVK